LFYSVRENLVNFFPKNKKGEFTLKKNFQICKSSKTLSTRPKNIYALSTLASSTLNYIIFRNVEILKNDFFQITKYYEGKY
jgi:hypothetical protein